MIFLQSYMIMLGGHLLETENKSIRQIAGLNSGHSCLRNLREFLKQYLTDRQNSWLLMGGGRYERVDCT